MSLTLVQLQSTVEDTFSTVMKDIPTSFNALWKSLLICWL